MWSYFCAYASWHVIKAARTLLLILSFSKKVNRVILLQYYVAMDTGSYLGGAMGAAAPGPTILGSVNFLCAICEIYCAATYYNLLLLTSGPLALTP